MRMYVWVRVLCEVTAKSIKPFSRKVEIRKQVPQQQSGVSYRAATKVAAKNCDNLDGSCHVFRGGYRSKDGT